MPDFLPKISALLITYNEAENISACLDSIDFADEIIVVDSYSTDGTFEILSNRKDVKVIQRTFHNFTSQKNFALDQATHDWILFIDADERITPELRDEIKMTLKEPAPDVHAYWFYRQFMFKGRKIHFSGWQTDKNIRLFRKSKARYSLRRIVHETLEVEGRTACLNQKLTHFCYDSFENFKGKMVLYGQLKAKESLVAGKKFTYLKFFVKPLYKFLYNYLIRLGILDGFKGLTLCYAGAFEDIHRYRTLKKLEREARSTENRPELRKATYSLGRTTAITPYEG